MAVLAHRKVYTMAYDQSSDSSDEYWDSIVRQEGAAVTQVQRYPSYDNSPYLQEPDYEKIAEDRAEERHLAAMAWIDEHI